LVVGYQFTFGVFKTIFAISFALAFFPNSSGSSGGGGAVTGVGLNSDEAKREDIAIENSNPTFE
jgi:hypothetical protein